MHFTGKWRNLCSNRIRSSFYFYFFISRSISVKNTKGCKKAAVIRALYRYFQVSVTKDVMIK